MRLFNNCQWKYDYSTVRYERGIFYVYGLDKKLIAAFRERERALDLAGYIDHDAEDYKDPLSVSELIKATKEQIKIYEIMGKLKKKKEGNYETNV